MTKKISDAIKVPKNKDNQKNLGSAIEKWISTSKNLSSLKIKMKFGEKGGNKGRSRRETMCLCKDRRYRGGRNVARGIYEWRNHKRER